MRITKYISGLIIFFMVEGKVNAQTSIHTFELVNHVGMPGNQGRYYSGIILNDRDSVLQCKVPLEYGKQSGQCTCYYKNGVFGAYGMINYGEKLGHWEYSFQIGQLAESGSYENGKKDGPWVKYYENWEKEPNTDCTVGETREAGGFIFTKSIASIENYKNGKLDGVASFYNIDGKVTEVYLYSNDTKTLLFPVK